MAEPRPWSPCLKAYAGMVAFSLAGSLLSRVARLDPGPIAPAASLLTLVLGLAAVFGGVFRAWGWKTALLSLLALGLVGAASEVAGLYTGLVFGRYEYTGAWWPSVALPQGRSFPLLLPLAWMMMAGGAWLAVRRLLPQAGPWGAALAGGLLAALLDVPMEPIMVHVLGYWTWLEPGPLPGGAPIANFVGWFATSALGSLALIWGEKRAEKEEPLSHEAIQALALHMAFLLGLGLIGRPDLP